ncbi:MAG TPA: hypothetical protein VMH91_03610 [Candidatus Paceibacterota bacterium]|nr:hypothetical protein [Candidatus Paceibacterota bacterium]
MSGGRARKPGRLGQSTPDWFGRELISEMMTKPLKIKHASAKQRESVLGSKLTTATRVDPTDVSSVMMGKYTDGAPSLAGGPGGLQRNTVFFGCKPLESEK